jgi:hypothetical protein
MNSELNKTYVKRKNSLSGLVEHRNASPDTGARQGLARHALGLRWGRASPQRGALAQPRAYKAYKPSPGRIRR